MGCPLILEMAPVPHGVVTNALECAGIHVAASTAKQRGTDCSEYICRRGKESFGLLLYGHPEEELLCIAFFANLPNWRWWNFPLLWLVSNPFSSKQIELQRDAYSVLCTLGARRVAGGEFLMLDDKKNDGVK